MTCFMCDNGSTCICMDMQLMTYAHAHSSIHLKPVKQWLGWTADGIMVSVCAITVTGNL